MYTRMKTESAQIVYEGRNRYDYERDIYDDGQCEYEVRSYDISM